MMTSREFKEAVNGLVGRDAFDGTLTENFFSDVNINIEESNGYFGSNVYWIYEDKADGFEVFVKTEKNEYDEAIITEVVYSTEGNYLAA